MMPSFSPTPEQRELVKVLASISTPEVDIAKLIECDPKTLRKHFREELDTARLRMKAFVVSKLYSNIKDGKEASVFFYLKTQCGWRETMKVENTGEDGGPILHDLTIIRRIIDPKE